MSDKQNIINEISTFLDKSMLKKSKITREELIDFIEKKWQEAGDEKYEIYSAYIISGRMINEYIRVKDFENMMRWLKEHNKHSASQKNPEYVSNYYRGQCCLECENEEKALEYFRLCYAENPDYIFTRAPFCYEFFNEHLENKRDLSVSDEEDDDLDSMEISLDYWKDFFGEKDNISLTILDEDVEEVEEPDEIQQIGLEYWQENQQKVLENILSAVLEQYPEWQKRYNYPEEDKEDFMPDLNDIQGFADLLTPLTLYVMSDFKDNFPYIGILFDCSWDIEHGLGVMTHKDRIVEIGGADTAFYVSE